MLVTAILKSIVRNGSLCVIDATGRRHTVGDGSPPEATLRLTAKSAEYTLALIIRPSRSAKPIWTAAW
jgi:cyclopropane-fatty-acyl-phospholipid synthase